MITQPDLTVIYLTLNKMPERWARFHMKHLRRATRRYPVITISREPMDFGQNLIQDEEPSYWNIYLQLLRGAHLAKTPFVAVAEDDTLYASAHFRKHRPPKDVVAYDMARWQVFAWELNPVFTHIQRCSNFAMIASRELVIEALTERVERYPKGHLKVGEIGIVEKRMQLTRRKTETFWAGPPMVNLAHDRGVSKTTRQMKGLKKRHGKIEAIEVPHWGKAKDIARVFNEAVNSNRG